MKDFFKGVRKHIDRLDAAHLREQYKLVADEFARTDMLIHALKEGIVRLDANGEPVQSNPAAKQLLGSDPVDAIRTLGLPEVNDFMDQFAPSFKLPLDALN